METWVTGLIVFATSFALITIFFPSSILASLDDPCTQKSCSPDGPPVRFPFFLQEKQPENCGYNSSYRLSCDEMNRTVLQLPISTQVVVTNIDYSSQIIQVQSLDQSCFAKEEYSKHLDIKSATPFQFDSSRYTYQYSLFNCSPPRESGASFYFRNVRCLDGNGYEVYAVLRNDPIDLHLVLEWLENCTKMYDTKPFLFELLDSKSMNLRLSLPECISCEVRGGTCKWNDTSSHQIGCFGGKEHHSRKSEASYISGSVMGSFLLMIALTIVYQVYSSYKKDKQTEMRLKKFLEDYTSMKPVRYSYSDLKKITNNVRDKLGEGGYGNVFKGIVSAEVFVAVKLLHNSIGNNGNGEEFINEVGTMGAIHHVNVVRLLGFCADGSIRALVYEYLSNGSLDRFILPVKRGASQSLGMVKLEEIAVGIARGIEYLHQGCEQRILHFDIKPHNILLDENYNPKISDFGLAKFCKKGMSAVSMTAARGTMGYIAPEVFSRQFGDVTYKSDIYSFGMLLLEMVGRRKNIDATVANASQVYFPEWIYKCLVDGAELKIELEDDQEVQIAKKLAIVGLWCIQWNPTDRPSITLVLQMLEGDGKCLGLPPNPFTSDVRIDNSADEPSTKRRHFETELAVISESE